MHSILHYVCFPSIQFNCLRSRTTLSGYIRLGVANPTVVDCSLIALSERTGITSAELVLSVIVLRRILYLTA